MPIAGYAELLDGGARLSMRGMVGDVDGEQLLTTSSDVFLEGRGHEERIEEARKLGAGVAQALLDQGARELMSRAEATVLERSKKLN